MEPESRYYESQRLRLHYAVWDDPPGSGKPPLLLIHGNRDHARNWDGVAEAMTGRFTVYAADLRGHGDSQWSIGGEYSFPEFTLDIARLVEIISPDGQLTIIGHSLGGGVAMQYAGLFPEKVDKLVSIEGWGPRIHERRPADVRMREWIAHMAEMDRRSPRRYATLDEAVARMREENPHLSPEMAHHLTLQGARQNEDGTWSWKFDNYVRTHSPFEFNMEDARTIWNGITCPMLLVKGAESWATNPAEDGRGSAFHCYRFVVVENAGHWVHHDQLDAFLRVVNQFLDEDHRDCCQRRRPRGNGQRV